MACLIDVPGKAVFFFFSPWVKTKQGMVMGERGGVERSWEGEGRGEEWRGNCPSECNT